MLIAKFVTTTLSVTRPAFCAQSTSAGYGIQPQQQPGNRRWLLGIGAVAGAMLLVTLAGQGSAVRPDQEVALLRHLAEDGEAGAQLQLGLAYREGRYGLTPDAKTSQYWLTQAANNGQGYATTPHDASSAHDQSNQDTWDTLATRLNSPTLKVIAGTWDLLTRYAMATQTADALLANAKAGNPTAEFQLGMRYRDGAWSVKRDPAEAEYWLQRAAHDGNRLAVQALAEMRHG